MACFSPIVNARGALYVHPSGIVKRTTYHVFSLYVNKLEKNVIPVTLSSEELIGKSGSVPVVDAILTCNDTRSRFVMAVVNKSPDKPVNFHPDFAGMKVKPSKKLTGFVLKGNSPDDYNDVGAENRVVPEPAEFRVTNGTISLPPHSLSLIIAE
jgi:alpha-N-arabinofuranosidase